jgi:2-methylcitrate dehydratase PrpD
LPDRATSPTSNGRQEAQAMPRTETVAAAIARSVRHIGADTLDARTIKYTQDLILSAVGGMTGGSRLPAGKMLISHVQSQGAVGEATVAGTRLKSSMGLAALANGTFAHATEYEDDSFPEAVTTFTVVPPLLAVAQARGIDGARFVQSVVVAQEVQSRLARAYLVALSRGHQLLPLMGEIATAAGVAYLIGLDEEQTARALCIAASQACGLRIQSGSMAHFLESGVAAQSGILSALLAADGFDGDPRAFEGRIGPSPRGLLEILAPDMDEIPDEVYEVWGPPYRVLDVTLKEYPMCGIITPLVQAVGEIQKEADFLPEDIEEVTVYGNRKLVDHCNFPDPVNSTESAFSIGHVIALAVRDKRDIDLESFEMDQVNDPQLANVRARTTVVTKHDWDPDFFKSPVQVTMTMKDGRTHDSVIEGVYGMPPSYLSDDDVARKFRASTRRVLSPERAERVIEIGRDLVSLGSAAEFAELLAADGDVV